MDINILSSINNGLTAQWIFGIVGDQDTEFQCPIQCNKLVSAVATVHYTGNNSFLLLKTYTHGNKLNLRANFERTSFYCIFIGY